jgi:hypothetical protein
MESRAKCSGDLPNAQKWTETAAQGGQVLLAVTFIFGAAAIHAVSRYQTGLASDCGLTDARVTSTSCGAWEGGLVTDRQTDVESATVIAFI